MRDPIRDPILVVLTVVVLLAGCSGSQSSLADTSSKPTADASSTPSAAATLSPTPTPAPVRTPKQTPAPTASTSASGPSDLFGLANATLDLPLRVATLKSCAQGPHTKFVKGRSGKTTRIAAAIEADLDHDGPPEVVAFIDCLPPEWGEGSPRQTVAFVRRADGTFATMGLVVDEVSAGAPNQDDDSIEDVSRMEAAAGGGVRIKVGDPATLYQDTGTSPGLYQQRTYGWNGTAIVQTSGSTSFVVPKGTFDLAVSASPMTYAKPVKGERAGSMTVTVRNSGPTTVEDVSVFLAMGGMPATCADPGGSPGPTCAVGSLAPDTSKTVSFHHTDPDCADCSHGGSLQVRIGDQKYGQTPSFSFVLQ